MPEANWKIVKRSSWGEKTKIDNPVRIVVIHNPSKKQRQYSTHEQVCSESKTLAMCESEKMENAFLIHGHYDMDFSQAVLDLHKRVEKSKEYSNMRSVRVIDN